MILIKLTETIIAVAVSSRTVDARGDYFGDA